MVRFVSWRDIDSRSLQVIVDDRTQYRSRTGHNHECLACYIPRTDRFKCSESKAARLADYTADDFDNLFATNVRSPFFLVHQLLPILGDGSNIIAISSIGSHAVVGNRLTVA